MDKNYINNPKRLLIFFLTKKYIDYYATAEFTPIASKFDTIIEINGTQFIKPTDDPDYLDQITEVIEKDAARNEKQIRTGYWNVFRRSRH